MSPVSHTPGRWEVFAQDREVFVTMGDSDHSIAKVYKDGVRRPEQLANAYLIAAAPDLLEAVELLLSACENADDGVSDFRIDGSDDLRDAVRACREAVAFARTEVAP